MIKITLGRGSMTVDNPPAGLKSELTYWKRTLGYDEKKHMRTMQGHYENLYSLDNGKLITLPGFGHRVINYLRKSGIPFEIEDKRVPMPAPNFELACQGLRDNQLEPTITALMSGGGIISLPTGFGKTRISSAIIRAFDPELLKLRGTPTIVFSAPDKDINRKNWEALSELFPDRDVGLVMSGSRKFSDDIQVITLDSLHLLNPDDVGILIVDEVHTAASASRSEVLSKFTRAARWGVSATPTGRFDGGDLLTEGLFGPVVVRRTYQDAVRLGALVPISVYWVKAPKPHVGMQYYSKLRTRDAKIKSAIVNNPEYSQLVAAIMNRIPDDKQTVCFTQWIKQMANIHNYCRDLSYVHAQANEGVGSIGPISQKARKEIYSRFESGDIRKIFATFCWKQGVDFTHLDIVVNASGGGSDIVAKQVPGRASRKAEGKDRAYVIDFIHEWDFEDVGGKRKPGPLMACDLARRRSYRELGFEQFTVNSLEELPFIKRI